MDQISSQIEKEYLKEREAKSTATSSTISAANSTVRKY